MEITALSSTRQVQKNQQENEMMNFRRQAQFYSAKRPLFANVCQ